MQNKIIFREMLSEIKILADKKGNCLTQKEVKDFFADAHLEEEQFKLIYEYLDSQKIKVEGFESENKGGGPKEKGETEYTAMDKVSEGEEMPHISFLEMYLNDVENVQPLSGQEEFELFEAAAAGDRKAARRLTEQGLKMVYELSMTYVGAQLPQEDLIQEGNMGLIFALEAIQKQESLEKYRACIFEAVRRAMEKAIEDSQDVIDMDEEIAGRVNHLNEAILNLEQDLGHKVSVEELSVYLEMPLEEIQDILRMAGDEMKMKA